MFQFLALTHLILMATKLYLVNLQTKLFLFLRTDIYFKVGHTFYLLSKATNIVGGIMIQ